MEDLMPQLEEEFRKKVKENPEIEETNGKVILISKFSGDGIGETEPIRQRRQNVLPSTMFKMSTMWLKILFRRKCCEDLLL